MRPSRQRRTSARRRGASLLLASLLVALSAARAPATDLLDEVRERARDGDREGALAILDRFLEESPDGELAAAARWLGASLEESAERAAARWQQIVTLHPEAPQARDAYLCLARLRLARGLHGAALEAIDALLERSDLGEPARSEAHYWSLLARIGGGEPATDLLGILKEIDREPWSGWASVALGHALLDEGKLGRADALFARESGQEGDEALSCTALFGKAEVLLARRQRKDAEELFERIRTECRSTIEASWSARALDELRESRERAAPAGTGNLSVALASFPTEEQAREFMKEYTAKRSEKPFLIPPAGPDVAASGADPAAYRVMVGEFFDRAPANDLANDLTRDGFQASVVER